MKKLTKLPVQPELKVHKRGIFVSEREWECKNRVVFYFVRYTKAQQFQITHKSSHVGSLRKLKKNILLTDIESSFPFSWNYWNLSSLTSYHISVAKYKVNSFQNSYAVNQTKFRIQITSPFISKLIFSIISFLTHTWPINELMWKE